MINSKHNDNSDNEDELIYKKIDKVNIDDLTQSSDTAYNTDIISPLDEFINKNKIPYGDKTYTHTLFLETPIIFKIDDNDYNKYIKLYTDEITKNNNKKLGHLNIMEKPKDIGYLCLDFDFKYKNNEKIFDTTNHIKNVVLIVNKIVSKYYKIRKNIIDGNDSENDEQTNENNEELKNILKSYITVKNEPYYDKNKLFYSNGFHIQYPNLVLSVVDRYFIYDEMYKYVIKNNIFNDLENKILNYNDIMDKSIIKKNQWFNYGSGKILGGKTYYYKLFAIYDINLNELDTNISIENLTKLLAIRHTKSRTVIYKNDELMKENHKRIKEKYMRNEIDKNEINNQNKKNIIKPNNLFIDNPKNIKKNNISDDENENNCDLDVNLKMNMLKKEILNNKNTNIENARRLVKLLKRERAEPYYDWITVCWILHGISTKLLPEFIEFSKLCPWKFSNAECIKRWREASSYNGKNCYSIATLYAWAKEDNLEEYNKLILQNVSDIVQNCDFSDYDVATIIYVMYGHEYKVSSLKNHTWWHFTNHRWEYEEKGKSLLIKLSTEVAEEFTKLYTNCNILQSQGSSNDIDKLEKKRKDIKNLIAKLKKNTSKTTFMAECEVLFYHSKFEELLNVNRYLIGFKNGVYDLKNKVFRNGLPDDYLTFTTKTNYVEYNENDQEIIDIENFVKSIQPEEDMRTYLMVYFASLLEGGNKNQRFVILTGSGSNGKGTLISLIDSCFGEYFGTVPISLLTQKRGSSSAASPELADKAGVRTLFMQESQETDVLQTGLMKELTGEDKIMARPLYGNPFYYYPQFKLIIACNNLPNITATDNGTWRRIVVIDFKTKFVKNPTKPNEKAIDINLRENLKKWDKSFMWLLINKYYPLYDKNDLDFYEPANVRMATLKYKQNSNIFIEFSKKFIDKTDDPENKVNIFLLYETFKNWHVQQYNDKKIPLIKKLNEYLNENDYLIDNGFIVGYKLKNGN